MTNSEPMLTAPESPFSDYSQPVAVKATRWGTLAEMQPYTRADRPGFEMLVCHDGQCNIFAGFVPRYVYTVDLPLGQVAGNHYHNHKDEVYRMVSGACRILLQKPGASVEEAEIIELSAARKQVLFVPRGIAHQVLATSQGAVLLVIASGPEEHADRIRYDFSILKND